MLRTLATSFSLAFFGSLVLGVTLPESSAYAQSKTPPPGVRGGKTPPKGAGKKKKNAAADGIGPIPKNQYPLQERMRPLVLPDGMGEVGLDLGYNRFAKTDFVNTDLSFNYGIGDVVELGAATGLLLAPDADWNRSFVIQGHFLAYDTKSFDFAPGLVLPFVFVDGAGFGAVVDLTSRYVASKTVFLTFGQGALPITFSPDFALALSGNGAVNFQVGKPSVLFVDTSVFTLLLAPDLDVTGLWDVLNLGLGAQYSPTKDWDVGARLGITNVWKLEDSLNAGITAYGRFRF